MADSVVDSPGDPRHPEFSAFLAELGAATYEAARLAGIAFDVLRVFGNVASDDMYNDPLGTLQARLERLSDRGPELPGLAEFRQLLGPARATRNDLLHALPVKDGLHRRRSDDPHYVRNFYTVEELSSATRELRAAHLAGSKVLYHDGGEAVRAWYVAATAVE